MRVLYKLVFAFEAHLHALSAMHGAELESQLTQAFENSQLLLRVFDCTLGIHLQRMAVLSNAARLGCLETEPQRAPAGRGAR